eukprot:TRINITY_DN540_c0_g1_i1.p1 TRINITY_DN540_c0_g1~~TRINITY_DN540_c0_g1_i1.p1  ORF type:complete len:461 (-),score=46.44 TRINITY_DN540_c0_g1_i1:470-1852(-)
MERVAKYNLYHHARGRESNHKFNNANFKRNLYSNQCLVSRLDMTMELSKHKGCVNTVNWSECGRYLVSGSDDCRVCVWDVYENGKLVASEQTGHTNNIFCTKFMPACDNSRIITCAADCEIRYLNMEAGKISLSRVYPQHDGRVKKLCTFDEDPNTFISGSEDGTVRLFDLRESTSSTGKVIVDLREPNYIEINCIANYGSNFCIGAGDPYVRVYDIRNMPGISSSTNNAKEFKPMAVFAPKHLINSTGRNYLSYKGHVTGVSIHKNEVLASYSGDKVYLYDIVSSNHVEIPVPQRDSDDEMDLGEAGDYFNQNDDDSGSNNDNGNDNDNDIDDNRADDSQPPVDGMQVETDEKEESDSPSILNDREEIKEVESVKIEKEEESVKIEPEEEMIGPKNSDERDHYVQSYSGHCNVKTVKGVSFFGPNGEYVVSGSDDGRIFVWQKYTGELVTILKGDKYVS